MVISAVINVALFPAVNEDKLVTTSPLIRKWASVWLVGCWFFFFFPSSREDKEVMPGPGPYLLCRYVSSN